MHPHGESNDPLIRVRLLLNGLTTACYEAEPDI